MSALTIATALFEAVPTLKKLVEHPLKGQDVAKKVSAIACHVTKHTDPSKIMETLNDNPTLLVEFYKKLMETEKDMYIAMLSDREQARKRTSPNSSRFMLFLSLSGLASCLFLLALGDFSGEVTALLSTASGIFGACLKDIYAFEFSGRYEG
jgi:hypothetical protein